MDIEWAIGVVQGFIEACEEHGRLWELSRDRESAEAEQLRNRIVADLPVIEQIADQAWPQWREWSKGFERALVRCRGGESGLSRSEVLLSRQRETPVRRQGPRLRQCREASA